MGQYFSLQCKRLGRFLPLALCITALLLGGLVVAAGAILGQSATGEDNQKIRIAIAGDTNNALLEMGLATITSMDSTNLTMEVLIMTEPEAEDALRRGDLSAYAVIPEGFMQSAMRGNMMSVRFVSNDKAGDMTTLFKVEVTRVVSDLLVSAQKGVFGTEQALKQNDLSSRLPGQMNNLAMTYVDYILMRDQVYAVEELGALDSLSLEDTLVCGLAVLLLLLMCLPFAPVVIRSDYALARMLHARRLSASRQLTAEFAAYGLMLALMAALPLTAVAVLAPERLAVSLPEAVLRLLPLLLMLAALSFLFYSLADHLIGGVLVHFFGTLALCFVSGCLYPVYFFPPAVQVIANRLPTGVARTQLAGCLTGADATETTLWLVGYSVLFLLVAGTLRLRRMKGVAR